MFKADPVSGFSERLQIIGHHPLQITPALKEHVLNKFSKLDAHFSNITHIQLTLEIEKNQSKASASLRLAGHPNTFHAEALHKEMYAAVTDLRDKLVNQLNTLKEKSG